MNKIVREINQFDVELFDYAQSLMAYRLKLVHAVLRKMKAVLGISQLSRGSSDRLGQHESLLIIFSPKFLLIIGYIWIIIVQNELQVHITSGHVPCRHRADHQELASASSRSVSTSKA